jgi:hypothetical protein
VQTTRVVLNVDSVDELIIFDRIPTMLTDLKDASQDQKTIILCVFVGGWMMNDDG